ncbi:MAG: hypothetical protein IPM24_00010 [Bryobacterales bacterium]|nr:hypothetical protein [Bryobacterales bacterium]
MSIIAAWRDLGGGPLRHGRGRAFWRGGDGWNISLDPQHGRWYDHAHGEGGGVLRLVQTVLGCDKAGALAWLTARGFLQDRQSTPEGRREFARRRAATEKEAAALASRAQSFYRHVERQLDRELAQLSVVLAWAIENDAEVLGNAAGEMIAERTRSLHWVRDHATDREMIDGFRHVERQRPDLARRIVTVGAADLARCREWGQIIVDLLGRAA